MSSTKPNTEAPELLPTLRKRFDRALQTALNFTGQSAGPPKVMLEISDVQYLLKWLDARAVFTNVDELCCLWTDEVDYWHSACGEDWCFVDGGPTENRVRFCQGCGKPVVLH